MLEQYLAEMLENVAEMERHIHAGPPADPLLLAASRGQLLKLLAAYQLHIHRAVFEPARASAHARMLKAECVMLAETHRAFVHQWPIDSISDQWAAFRTAALRITEAFHAHGRAVLGTPATA